jgi:Acetyltransferase (GNAT) domain
VIRRGRRSVRSFLGGESVHRLRVLDASLVARKAGAVHRKVRRRLSLAGNLYRGVGFCNLVLLGVFRVPTPWLRSVTRRAASLAGELFATGLFLSRTHTPFRVTVSGSKLIFLGSYEGMRELKRVLGGDVGAEVALPEIEPRQVAGCARAWLSGREADLVICELPRLLRAWPKAPIAVSIPTWIDQVITLPEDASIVLGRLPRKRRQMIRKCLERGYGWRYTSDDADFEWFYRDVYAPFTRRRYGARTLPTPYEVLTKLRSRGGVIFVTADGRDVGGVLCHMSDGICYIVEEGFIDEPDKYWKEGGTTILMWFALQWAYEQGATAFHAGGTRGWHSDGVFWFKSQWGARVQRRSGIYPEWRLLAEDAPAPLRDQLNGIGFLVEVDGRYYGVHIGDDALPSEQHQLVRTAARRRLDGVLFVSPSRQMTITPDPLETDLAT